MASGETKSAGQRDQHPTSEEGANARNVTHGLSMSSQILSAKETLSVLNELSRLLNTGLSEESLALCVRLCENGANPEALATVIKEIRNQSQAIKEQVKEESES